MGAIIRPDIGCKLEGGTAPVPGYCLATWHRRVPSSTILSPSMAADKLSGMPVDMKSCKATDILARVARVTCLFQDHENVVKTACWNICHYGILRIGQ